MNLHRVARASVMVAVLSLLVTLGVWLVAVGGPATADRDEEADGRSAGPDHVEVLRAWDRERAEAWARGDVASLRDLYVPGSRSGRRDVRMLRRYVARGLVVRGLRTQLIRVRPLRREDDLLVLDVVDRVASAEVVGDGVRSGLPADRPSRREVELRREEGDAAWRVVEARESAR